MISSWCFPLAASASSTALSFSRLVIMMIILMSVIVCSDDDGFMWWLMMMWLVVSIVMMMMTMRIIFNVILTCWPSPGWPPPVSQHIALQMEADYKYIHMKAEQIWQINIENFQDQCSYLAVAFLWISASISSWKSTWFYILSYFLVSGQLQGFFPSNNKR